MKTILTSSSRPRWTAITALVCLIAVGVALAGPGTGKKETAKKPGTSQTEPAKPQQSTPHPNNGTTPAPAPTKPEPTQQPAIQQTPAQVNPTVAPNQEEQPMSEAQTGETLKWQVISAGGVHSTGGSYKMDATVGQNAVGISTGSNYKLSAGFWYASASGCCVGIRGDANNNGSTTITDITFIVSYLFNSGPAPVCFDEANVNGVGSITITDLTYLVSFLFAGGAQPPACP